MDYICGIHCSRGTSNCSKNFHYHQFRPVYNGPSVTIRPSICALVVLFLYTLKRLSSTFLHIADVFNVQYYTWRQNFMEKYNKFSSKMYKHLVQQTEHNNYAALLIKQFVFTKLVESIY